MRVDEIVQASPQEGSMGILIRGGSVIDGRGGHLPKGDVLIQGGRITRIESGLAASESDTKVIDAAGMTVLPGLIDCHVHITMGETLSNPKSWTAFAKFHSEQEAGFLAVSPKAARDVAVGAYNARLTLEAGFTTVRDLGAAAGHSDVVIREAIVNGFFAGPRILASGGGIAMTGGHGWNIGVEEADGPEEILKLVRRQLKVGADVIKFFATRAGSAREMPGGSEFTVGEMRVICEEARQRGKRTAAHAIGKQGIKNAILAGVDTIEHGCFVDDECIDLMLERGTALISTLLPYKRQAEQSAAQGYPGYVATRSVEIMEAYPRNLRRAWDRGVTIALGSDCGIPRLTPHGDNARELALFVDLVRVPSLDVIGLATRNGALALGISDSIGTLEPGKLADVLVVDGDPLREIGVLFDKTRLRYVLKEGEVVARDGKAL